MVVRPLPQLTPWNEWFWTSGADGSLRIQRCADCQTLVHPPVPICPVCRSLKWEASVVSGRGTVVGFTVNSHQWLPGFEPPYVIANVALAEDASVRLDSEQHVEQHGLFLLKRACERQPGMEVLDHDSEHRRRRECLDVGVREKLCNLARHQAKSNSQ
jgi:uncharacterized OB-fold protein